MYEMKNPKQTIVTHKCFCPIKLKIVFSGRNQTRKCVMYSNCFSVTLFHEHVYVLHQYICMYKTHVN